jgi:hypothetical protein
MAALPLSSSCPIAMLNYARTDSDSGPLSLSSPSDGTKPGAPVPELSRSSPVDYETGAVTLGSSSASPEAGGTATVTVRHLLQRHLLTPLARVVVAYAHTRDVDLVVSWQSDADHVYTPWLCGPCEQDALAGWQLPIHLDVGHGYEIVLKAVDLVGLPGVTLVCRARATPKDARCTWMLRLPPLERDNKKEPRRERHITATKLPLDDVFWGGAWHDRSHIYTRRWRRWSPELGAWQSPDADGKIFVNDLEWDGDVHYAGFLVRAADARLEWYNPQTGVWGGCAFPAAPQTRYHGLVVRPDTGILYAAVRCCRSEEFESHPETVTIWSTRLVATTRLDVITSVATLEVDPLTWVPTTLTRFPAPVIFSGSVDKCHLHSYNDWYRIRGTLPDGRVWFSTGAEFIVQDVGAATDQVARGSCGWRYSARDEYLFHLLGFTSQPDRGFCAILA